MKTKTPLIKVLMIAAVALGFTGAAYYQSLPYLATYACAGKDGIKALETITSKNKPRASMAFPEKYGKIQCPLVKYKRYLLWDIDG